MKIWNLFKLFIAGAMIFSCQAPAPQKSKEELKSELFAVEKEFSSMAQSEGIAKAFVFYAADSAVLLRKDQLIIGKESIGRKYASFPENVKLEWAADFADVAASGDLGYTYGKFTYTAIDSLGKTTQSEGIFHTVWKRQLDGKWRFVWD